MPSSGRIKTTLPQIPPLQVGRTQLDLQKQIEDLSRRLDRFFTETRYFVMDHRFFPRSAIQNIDVANFIVEPTEFMIELIVTAPRTSHTTTPIRQGTPNQFIMLQNVTAFTITMKYAATNLILAGAADWVMTPGSTLGIRWVDVAPGYWVQWAGVII